MKIRSCVAPRARLVLCAALAALFVPSSDIASAQCVDESCEGCDAGPPACDGAASGCDGAAAPAPVYDGSLCCRSVLTGDWCGYRACFAESGITFDLDNVYIYQGVTSGGLNQEWEFGGHGDYLVNVDFGKLCDKEGLSLKLRAEHNFGRSVNSDTGDVFPVALQLGLPTTETHDLALTNVLFTQALSENFAVFGGKLDTLDGDANAFAHGRGKTQFMNAGFCYNPIVSRAIPYSTLGTGFIVLQEGQPILTYSLINSTDTATTSGFDELFEDGVAMALEVRLPTRFLSLPGHQAFGAAWNSRTFEALGQDPRILLPGGDVAIAKKDGTWALYWNFDQYLATYACDDAKGWGVFGRVGISDGNPNPLERFYSVGIGGDSPLASRRNDRFGVGWFYAEASDELGLIATSLLSLGDGQGVELFYNYEVTPWFHLTPDLQIIDPARRNVDTAVVVGFRGEVDF